MNVEDDHTHVDPFEARAAEDANIGDGTPESAPLIEPAVGTVEGSPVRATLIPVALAAFAAAGQAFIDGATTRGVVTAVIGALVVAAQEYTRSKVTPIAAPKLEEGVPLVPDAF